MALAGSGVQLVSDSDASHRRRSGPAGPGCPHSGREYNCRQRRLIPARPWVYLIRVTLVTVESSFNELLSGPWPGQLAVWPAALCFKCGVVLHEVRSRKLTQIKTVCFGVHTCRIVITPHHLVIVNRFNYLVSASARFVRNVSIARADRSFVESL